MKDDANMVPKAEQNREKRRLEKIFYLPPEYQKNGSREEVEQSQTSAISTGADKSNAESAVLQNGMPSAGDQPINQERRMPDTANRINDESRMPETSAANKREDTKPSGPVRLIKPFTVAPEYLLDNIQEQIRPVDQISKSEASAAIDKPDLHRELETKVPSEVVQSLEPVHLIKPFTIGAEYRSGGLYEQGNLQATSRKNDELPTPFSTVISKESEEAQTFTSKQSVIPLNESDSMTETPHYDKEVKVERNDCTIQPVATGPMIRPLHILSDFSVEKAQQILAPGNIPDDVRNTLIPQLALKIDENDDLKRNLAHISIERIQRVGKLNFRLSLQRIHVRVVDTEKGTKELRSYVVKVQVSQMNGEVRQYEAKVAEDKIKGTDWLKRATGSLARIPSGKEEKEDFDAMVQQCIETPGVPCEFVYTNAGWRNVPGLGWKYVYRDGCVGESNALAHTICEMYSLNVCLPEVGTSRTFFQAIEMTEICRNQAVSRTLFLYVHATLLTTLFELAGFPLNFVYILQGVTNSRKTSLVTAIGKIFDREKLIADAEFATATKCGIEKTASLYRDAAVLIDDFKPGATPAQRREMEEKLDEIIRLYGNRVAKKRMNDYSPSGEEKYYPVGGGCIITAEYLTGVSSTLTRAFVTEIGSDDVDNERLQKFQSEKWILPTHVYDFLMWVTAKFDDVVDLLKRRFPALRDHVNFQYGRHNDMYVVLLITAGVICWYADERGFWGREEQNRFLQMAQDNILTILKGNQDRIKEKNKGKIVLQLLHDALNTSQIIAAELNDKTCKQNLDVYKNESYLFVRLSALQALIAKHGKEGYGIGEMSGDELLMQLENLQVLDVEEKDGRRTRSRKLPIQRGNTKRYLYLKREVMKKLVE